MSDALQVFEFEELVVRVVREVHTSGGKQKMSVVNECGLYHLLFNFAPTEARGVSEEYIKERQAIIKKFRRWVTHEVLPSIRKTGLYSIPDSELKEEEKIRIVMRTYVCS